LQLCLKVSRFEYHQKPIFGGVSGMSDFSSDFPSESDSVFTPVSSGKTNIDPEFSSKGLSNEFLIRHIFGILLPSLIFEEDMFRFIHTADIHLDSPLKSLALRDPQIADIVGGATRRTFERIIDLCLNERVDALIIAGDLYDGNQRSLKTAAFLSGQMRRLKEANIRVLMIQGNHDSESSITPYLDLSSNVHVFTGQGGVEELRELGVAIHGVSYAERHAPESLLRKYRQPVKDLINIGIMHTSLAGAEGHDAYAPYTLKDLNSHGFDYWALGHIHQRNIHAENPFVVMPGIPQGRDIGESGPKSVTIVELEELLGSEVRLVQLLDTAKQEALIVKEALHQAQEDLRKAALPDEKVRKLASLFDTYTDDDAQQSLAHADDTLFQRGRKIERELKKLAPWAGTKDDIKQELPTPAQANLWLELASSLQKELASQKSREGEWREHQAVHGSR
jgi:DNA repair exonuclease SbcCD nuclease subunit